MIKGDTLDFKSKKQKYKKTHHNLQKIITNDNIFFGSGGSSNIIVIHDDIVLKIIPDFKKLTNQKIKPNNDQTEIKFYDFFTDKFVVPCITPHIVGFYDHYKLNDIKILFPKKCLTKSESLLVNPKSIPVTTQRLCGLKQEYDVGEIIPKADILVLEKCSSSIEKEINNILNTKKNMVDNLNNFINRTMFQFMYTLAVIQDMYPRFIHNDMFLRNILGITETSFCDNDYVEYKYKNKSYYLHANGFYLKINDFGYSLNPPHITSTLLDSVKDEPLRNMSYDDNLRDVFTFVFDYYDGANLGHLSVMEMIKDKSHDVKKAIRNTFKKYIKVKTIDKINKINRQKLAWMWNIKDVPLLRKTVVQPKRYFDFGVFKEYTVLPPNGKIVMTYSM